MCISILLLFGVSNYHYEYNKNDDTLGWPHILYKKQLGELGD